MPSIQLRGHKNIISQNVTRCTMATVQRLTGQVIRPSYCFRQEWCSSSFIFSQFSIWKLLTEQNSACFRKGKCACAKAEKQRENWPLKEKSGWKTFLHITIIAASAFQYKAAWRRPWLCFAALLLCCFAAAELTQKLLLRNWTSFLHSFFSQCQPQEKKVLSVYPKTWGLIGWSLLLSVLWLVGVLVHAWGMHTGHVGVFGRNFVFLMAPGQDGGDFLLPAAWSAFSFDILVGFCQTYF